MQELSFRSPLRKLVAFFQKSRDQWKQKCFTAKHDLKLLRRRYANLQRNRDRWKSQCQEAEAQRQELQQRVEVLTQERAARC